jgi:hypothetical protein
LEGFWEEEKSGDSSTSSTGFGEETEAKMVTGPDTGLDSSAASGHSLQKSHGVSTVMTGRWSGVTCALG